DEQLAERERRRDREFDHEIRDVARTQELRRQDGEKAADQRERDHHREIMERKLVFHERVPAACPSAAAIRSSCVAFFPYVPATVPSWIMRMRSLMPMSSGNSLDTTTTALPASVSRSMIS